MVCHGAERHVRCRDRGCWPVCRSQARAPRLRLEVTHLSAVTGPSLTGRCLCGRVRFELTEAAVAAGYCHCTRCQRRTGTAASAQARIDGGTFRLLQGQDSVKGWRHPDGGFEKCFCSECGAHLFSRNPDDAAQMSVRMGAFDGDPGVRPSWRTYVAYAACWEPIPDDALERFDEGKPPF
jgi:hypothetical protein